MSSSGQLDPDEAASAASSAIKDAASTSSTRTKATGAQLRRQFGAELVQAGTAVLAIGVLTFVFGNFIGFNLAFWLFVGLAAGAFVVNRVGGFSVPFGLSVAAAALWAGSLLPGTVTEPLTIFAVLFEQATGLPVRSINPVEFGVITGAVILFIWVLDIRIFSGFRRESGRPEAVNASTVARALVRRFRQFLAEWRQVVAALAFAAVILAVAVLQTGADFAGETGGVIAEAPVVFAALVNWATGFLALGGELPLPENVPLLSPLLAFIESTLAGAGPYVWALVAGIIIVAAIAVRELRS